MSRHVAEAIVLGGGPAGCAAAVSLARLGHDVVMITRPGRSRPAVPESIPPSADKLFSLIGVADDIETAGFIRSTGNTVWWGGGHGRVEAFAPGRRGWQVASTALERVLQAAAVRAGVRVERTALNDTAVAGLSARFLLDCTGRAGLLARTRARRQLEPGHRTVALAAVWRRRGGWDLPDESHTVIESYEDGWAWSVPVDAGQRAVTVMVDPGASRLARGAPALDVYRRELAKTRRFAALVAEADLDNGPFGWDASMYSSDRYAGDGFLLVGDAGSFIDPLSSAGVKKALASGWLAAIAVHTCLVRPAMRDAALEFFSAREAEAYAGFLRLTRQFLARAAEGHDHPFWTDRRGPLEPDDDLPSLEPDALRRDPAVRAAFEWMRAAPHVDLARGESVRLEPRAAIAGSEIVLEARLVTPGLPGGLRYLRDVDLVGLTELAPAFAQVPDLYEAYCRRHSPVALPDFLGALATALARGWLVPRDRPPA